jgi:hypothetical protein
VHSLITNDLYLLCLLFSLFHRPRRLTINKKTLSLPCGEDRRRLDIKKELILFVLCSACTIFAISNEKSSGDIGPDSCGSDGDSRCGAVVVGQHGQQQVFIGQEAACGAVGGMERE